MAESGWGRAPGRRRGEGPDPIDVHVGSQLRSRRIELGLSQEKLGEALGLTFQQVQKYERGANRVSASRLFEMGQVLNVSVPFFFEGLPNPGESGNSAYGLSEAAAPTFERDPLDRPETKDLVEVFHRIEDPALRRKFLELGRTLAATLGHATPNDDDAEA